MPHKKLLEIVRVLPAPKIKRLRQFLQSPYFNGGYNAGQMLELFEMIVKSGADEEHPALGKAKLSALFFPGKIFKEKEKNPIDSLASDLFQQVRQFIVQENLNPETGNEVIESLALARFYRENGFEERFEQTILIAQKLLENSKFQDADYFHQKFKITEEIISFQSDFNVAFDETILVQSNENLDAFYVTLKLEQSAALEFQRQKIELNVGNALLLTVLLMDTWGQATHLKTPLNQLSKQVLELLNQPDDEQLLATFETTLDLFREEIPHKKFRNLKAYYRHFLGRKLMQKGGRGAFEQMFDVFEKHLNEGSFYLEDKILPGSLKTLVNMAIKLGKADWAEKLLADHPPERISGTRFQDEFHKLCLAEVFFFKKDYETATGHLTYCLFENVTFRLLADVLLVKIYMETNNDLLENRIKALEQKVRRSGLSAEAKEPYLNFIKKLDKIIRYGHEKNSQKMSELADEIKSTKAILQRDWLLRLLNK